MKDSDLIGERWWVEKDFSIGYGCSTKKPFDGEHEPYIVIEESKLREYLKESMMREFSNMEGADWKEFVESQECLSFLEWLRHCLIPEEAQND